MSQKRSFEICKLLNQPRRSKDDVDRLMELLQADFGDEIFKKASGFVRSARGYLDHQIAEDWVQEVWLSFIRRNKYAEFSAEKSKGENGYRPWVRKIYTNNLIDLYRHELRDPNNWATIIGGIVPGIEDPNLPDIADPTVVDPIHELRDDEIGLEIRKGIQHLSPKQQLAYSLVKIQNLSYKDAAKIMSTSAKTVSTNTVKAHVHKANRRLISILVSVYDDL